jgi:hypothetical protein
LRKLLARTVNQNFSFQMTLLANRIAALGVKF